MFLFSIKQVKAAALRANFYPFVQCSIWMPS